MAISKSNENNIIVELSNFSLDNVDPFIYPPPYLLNGFICGSTFSSDTSTMLETPKWILSHRFEYDNTIENAKQTFIIECYSKLKKLYIGKCCVPMQIIMETAANANTSSSSSSSSEIHNILKLELFESNKITCTISFHVNIEQILLIYLNPSRITFEPSLPLPIPLYIELSYCDEDLNIVVTNIIRSTQPVCDIKNWLKLPILKCRTSLSAFIYNGINGSLVNDRGETLALFHINIPETLLQMGEENENNGEFTFPFSEPVNTTWEQDTVGLQCVGEIKVILKSQNSIELGELEAVGESEIKYKNIEEVNSTLDNDRYESNSNNNNNDKSINAFQETYFTGNPNYVRVLGEVLQQRQMMVISLRERISWVRKRKYDFMRQVERMKFEEPRGDLLDLVKTNNLELELQSCIEQRNKLENELKLLQEQKKVAAKKREIQRNRDAQRLHGLSEELSETTFLYNNVNTLQEEMLQHVLLEGQKNLDWLQIATEEQDEVYNDAEILERLEESLMQELNEE